MTTTTTSASNSTPPSHPHHLLHITTPATASSSTTSRSPRGATSTSSSSSSHHHHHHPNSNSTSSNNNSNSGSSSSTNQACAACKYQRRRCNPDCPLAPYFPAEEQRRFLNAHRLFGVSNILKTLRRLDPSLCPDAMRSLIFQADARALDPVGGCCRIILDLERQLDLANAELAAVLHHLALCRQAAATNAAAASAIQLPPAADLHHLDATSTLLLNLNANANANASDDDGTEALYTNDQETGAAILQPPPQHEQQQQQQLYDYFYYEAISAGDDASSKTSSDGTMQHYVDGCTGGKAEAAESLVLGQQLEQHCQIDHQPNRAAADVDMKPLPPPPQQQPQGVDVFYNMSQAEAMEGHGGVGDSDGEEDEAAKNDMAAQMSDSSHCRLGLGFSSF